MAIYSVAEARDGLTRLLQKAEAGEDVVITRHGQPIAKVVGIAPKPAPTQADRDAIWARIDALRESMPPADIPSVELIRQLRDEGP
jgi:prevent-host-death family protein